ncbi:hypothetical protein BJY52DRAFT_1191052 [Lactarius psammicola]|nr:hypothetical protein BJY52DRAFT_1191052 [Lactarius psammicola]
MAPRTRRSQMGVPIDHTHGGPNGDQALFQTSTRTGTPGNTVGSSRNTTRNKVPLTTRKKRTFSSSGDTATSMPLDTQVSAAKRPRTIGPAHSRPMPLKLADESEIVDQQGYDGSVIKGKSKQVPSQGTPSFYPRRSDTTTHIVSGRSETPTSYLQTDNPYKPDVDDHDDTETEEDDNEQIVELALKNPARFSEVMATERPIWKASGGIDMPRPAELTSRQSFHGPVLSGSVSGCAPADATPVPMPMPPPTPGSEMCMTELSAETPSPNGAPTRRRTTPDSPIPILRADTDLVFTEGSTKLMLTNQRPIIRAVIQDAIENLRASILFTNAFPDATIAFALSSDALKVAAESHKPDDGEYLAKLVPLPRARICLFRGEVKDRCNAVSVAALFAIGSAPEIARLVTRQLSHYTYTFPGAPGDMGVTGLVRRSQPYRNPRIIAVIRDLYFTGGSNSFASRFNHLFPTYQGNDGMVHQEVPIPMVSLVATALYATLYEWRTGEQQALEFSANAYMDVYHGHVNTFKHILENRERAFHTMMSDIYTQASKFMGNMVSTIPIADLDLDALEE